MSALRRIVRLLAICCVCAVMSSAEETTKPGANKDPAVTMEITNLDVNGSTLTLSYNIRNGTDREAWVCSKSSSDAPFEAFLTSDQQTLLIRKRLDVPTRKKWRLTPSGMYARITPGASLTESVQIPLPVSPVVEYAYEYAEESAQPVRHLALEIGYYDDDLPALIHSIFAVVDKSGLAIADVPSNLLNTYFRGLLVRGYLATFDEVNPNPYERGYVYVRYNWQALTGEKVLRADVNDVSIPYKYPREEVTPPRR